VPGELVLQPFIRHGRFSFLAVAMAADHAGSRHNHRALLWLNRGLGQERPTSILQFWHNCIACNYYRKFPVIVVIGNLLLSETAISDLYLHWVLFMNISDKNTFKLEVVKSVKHEFPIKIFTM
jgi:hypothetical protein